MHDSPPPGPPAWVAKRDGQLVPFDADKISRALFAATEDLGRPDAFLARELADGVVHFLGAESEGAPPTTEQVAETVVKVVRELGQPALAEAYAHARRRRGAARPDPAARRAPRLPAPAAPAGEVVLRLSADTPLSAVLSRCAREYTLQTVFTRDLLAAQADGLLTLTGLESPDELAGCVLPPPPPDSGLIPALEELRRFVGGLVVLDAPEYLLASGGRSSAPDFVRDLRLGLRLTGLRAVVNLNTAAPPSWAGELAEGPLFASQRRPTHGDAPAQWAVELAEALLPPASPDAAVRVDWHLSERDFEPGRREQLHRLARAALEGAALAFVFDRPRRPAALAEGIDRPHPAALLTVGLHLPRLARQPGVDGDPSRFLSKLGSLARLALSAGVQKREYLRRRERGRPRPPADGPALTSGFLLDRARLVVAPVGLEAVVAEFCGKGLSAGGSALDLGRQIVLRLRDVLRQDGRTAHLDTCLDGPYDSALADERGRPAAADVAGLTAWDATAAVKNQLRSAGVLHAAAEHGTAALFVPPEQTASPEQVVEWLHTAWQQTDVVRLRVVRGVGEERQLTFPDKGA